MADQIFELDGNPVPAVEIGQGEVAVLMSQWVDRRTTWIAARDTGANFARILLPGEAPTATEWTAVAEPLAAAIAADVASGILERVALAISWWASGIMTALSIEGEARCVALLLADAVPLVRPDMPASSWIEAFRDALLNRAPELEAPVEWPKDAAKCGRLTLIRKDNLEFQIQLSTDLINALHDYDAGKPS